MTFRRRLVLFFALIALVPSVTLAAMLVLVGEDSREGKADARLAAGLDTAVALYEGRVAKARPPTRRLARSPRLGRALRGADREELERFAAQVADRSPITAVEVLDQDETVLAQAGEDDAIAFDRVRLLRGSDPIGTLRVSVTTGGEFAAELRRLTKRELVVSHEGRPISATVQPPAESPEVGETADLDLPEGEFRARRIALDPSRDETLLLLGPRQEGGLLAVGRSAAAILGGFLLLGLILAYALAGTLGGLHARVAEQAITDPLTGLWNRRRMDELLGREAERALRFGHELSLVIVDVDDFKQINDQRGHQHGDAVLEKLGELVARTTRSIDVPARYGGDELALLLVETDLEGARVLADRLRAEVADAEAVAPDGSSVPFTVSAGVATLPDSADSVEGLIEAADKALLRAKRTGKNRTFRAPRRTSENGRRGGDAE